MKIYSALLLVGLIFLSGCIGEEQETTTSTIQQLSTSIVEDTTTLSTMLTTLSTSTSSSTTSSSSTTTIVEAKPTYSNISAEEFKELVDDEETFVLDVHIPKQRHIKGTDAFIPFNLIKQKKDELPEDEDEVIAVYCRSGSMSVYAANELVKLGYNNVYNLVGGINAWKEMGYELE